MPADFFSDFFHPDMVQANVPNCFYIFYGYVFVDDDFSHTGVGLVYLRCRDWQFFRRSLRRKMVPGTYGPQLGEVVVG